MWTVHTIYSNCLLLESLRLTALVASHAIMRHSSGSRVQVVKLTAADVPRAELAEPLKIHGIPL